MKRNPNRRSNARVGTTQRSIAGCVGKFPRSAMAARGAESWLTIFGNDTRRYAESAFALPEIHFAWRGR